MREKGRSAFRSRVTSHASRFHHLSANACAKRSLKSCLGITALLALSGCATPSVEGSKKPLPAAVVRIKGQARYMSGGQKTWQVLKLKDTVHSGDVIQTGMEKGCFVDIAAPPPLIPSDFYVSNANTTDSALIPPNGWDRRLWSTPAPMVNPYIQQQEEQKRRRLILRVFDDSALKFEQLAETRASNDSQFKFSATLDLQKGHMMFQVFRARGASDCQVRFTNCRATIGGGIVDIS